MPGLVEYWNCQSEHSIDAKERKSIVMHVSELHKSIHYLTRSFHKLPISVDKYSIFCDTSDSWGGIP